MTEAVKLILYQQRFVDRLMSNPVNRRIALLGDQGAGKTFVGAECAALMHVTYRADGLLVCPAHTHLGSTVQQLCAALERRGALGRYRPLSTYIETEYGRIFVVNYAHLDYARGTRVGWVWLDEPKAEQLTLETVECIQCVLQKFPSSWWSTGATVPYALHPAEVYIAMPDIEYKRLIMGRFEEDE